MLDVVGLRELAEQTEDGLDTDLGEQGDRLSGGQRRRLCVARAALRRPVLLLLDEPTAGVDRPTAERMLRRLRAYLPESTIVVATHENNKFFSSEGTLSVTVDLTTTVVPQRQSPGLQAQAPAMR